MKRYEAVLASIGAFLIVGSIAAALGGVREPVVVMVPSFVGGGILGNLIVNRMMGL